ncbi:DUF2956 domain-containing protein [Thalassotalea sp. G2M2-11]|uniref:DUF2956 domain-containing protein n=1 Tax=Thalassotalea sp. G2M2-11 TaxID=2787627 RepID=UPI0019D25BCA|nr:DUF2956 domain-containing protein [Thalassotalea sp. G2M2-11]
MKHKPSVEIQSQAMKIAKGNQKKGQTKEQTKLIAQGIEKGIAQYKKQQSQKQRERDKQRKKNLHQAAPKETQDITLPDTSVKNNSLPWLLLALSWLGFILYLSWR